MIQNAHPDGSCCLNPMVSTDSINLFLSLETLNLGELESISFCLHILFPLSSFASLRFAFFSSQPLEAELGHFFWEAEELEML